MIELTGGTIPPVCFYICPAMYIIGEELKLWIIRRLYLQ